MDIKKEHIKTLIANDDSDRFQKLENPEGYKIYFDTYTRKYFVHDTEGLGEWYKSEWLNVSLIAIIKESLWKGTDEEWERLATPLDRLYARNLDDNPDFSITQVLSDGETYLLWFLVDDDIKNSLYLPVEKEENND